MCDVKSIDELASNYGMTFVHWNCRSLFPKLEEVIHLIESSCCECLCLSETWLTPVITDGMISIPNHLLFRSDRDKSSNKTKGGGVCMYVKENLSVSRVDNASMCTMDIEVLTLNLKLTNTRPVYIIGIYRPPSGNIVNFIDNLEEIICRLS